MAPMLVTPQISAEELRTRFQQCQKPGRDFVVVDLRGDDFGGGTIRSSLNIPMQSFAFAVPTLFSLTSSAKVSEVIFFCGRLLSNVLVSCWMLKRDNRIIMRPRPKSRYTIRRLCKGARCFNASEFSANRRCQWMGMWRKGVHRLDGWL